LVDQHQNFREAIRNRKARIQVIDSILAQPMTGGGFRSRHALAKEKVRHEEAIAELEAEDARLLKLSSPAPDNEVQQQTQPDQVEAVKCAPDQPGTPATASQPRVEERSNRAFVRTGTTWLIAFDEETCHLPHQVGLDYLARLLENAGRPIKATDLAATCAPGPSSPGHGGQERAPVSDGRLLQERLDPKAMKEYRDRISQLNAEITEARGNNDGGRAHLLEIELETIREQLESDTGHHGRGRTFSDPAEKARDSVRMAIDRAIKAIAGYCPNAAAHLKAAIKKGSEVVYRDTTTAWHVSRIYPSRSPSTKVH
jgi:hypothetical protein